MLTALAWQACTSGGTTQKFSLTVVDWSQPDSSSPSGHIHFFTMFFTLYALTVASLAAAEDGGCAAAQDTHLQSFDSFTLT